VRAIKRRYIEEILMPRGAPERGVVGRIEYGKGGRLIIYICQTGPETYLEELLALFGEPLGIVLK
ncbi:MAG: hypothetical protein IJS65_03430, partial [Clostridia bacterium]|nr:hypothetical protein [Clostridia bacterium]